MKKNIILYFGIAMLILNTSCELGEREVVIVYPQNASKNESLAAKEVRRYVYQRTGKLLPLKQSNTLENNEKDLIVVARSDRTLLKEVMAEVNLDLNEEEFILKTISLNGKKVLLLNGGSEIGTLYASYRFAEHLGVRFYLHGDVIPDEKMSLSLPDIDERHSPLFADRGIQPFHDFTEGPDWWTADDYKTYMSQIVKMRMNWIGFHCYPEGGVGPEPLVWIGLADDVNDDGTVKYSYPSRWASSTGGSWGYAKTPTSEFAAGAGLLFPDDDFGSPVTDGYRPVPKNLEDNNAVFNRAGDFLNDVFSYGRDMGLKVVIGTETPLTIPSALEKYLRKKGKNPKDPKTVQKLYEGMFKRIAKSYPIDYYWLWTPEGWTWSGTKDEEVKAAMRDMDLAMTALEKIGKPFGFATSGWVLGPPQDRTLFDKTLPKDVPLSCINRYVGFDWVEEGFADISGRPKWAIPWMEDDPAMIIPQLWVGRMRKDAADALTYGCTGLMGIHWRTAVLAPNVAALARAAWEQKTWNTNFGKPWVKEEPPSIEGGAEALYADFPDVKINNTTEEDIYKTMAYAMNDYYLDLPNGLYTVQLKFCELYFHEDGKRVFDVKIQNKPAIKDLDIYAMAGFSTALDKKVKNIKVVNGRLHIKFERKQDNPSIAGIVITDSKTSAVVKKINCGGQNYRDYEKGPGLLQKKVQKARDLPVVDFYQDWARAEFGKAVAGPLGEMFIRLDGGAYSPLKKETNLPRPSDWIGGPGGIKVNKTPWDKEKDKYKFVDEMAMLREEVEGAGNLSRFDYWLNTFQFLRAVGEIGCTRGRLDKIMEEMKENKEASKTSNLATEAVKIRITMARQWETMMTLLLQTVQTPGELGTVANCEQHVRRNSNKEHFLDLHDKRLEEILGQPLPAEIHPTKDYLGGGRLIVLTRRSRIGAKESLKIPVIILDSQAPQSAVLFWREMGKSDFYMINLDHQARAVYSATLPPATGGDIEYYIEAKMAEGKKLVWPATAPGLNQTVVVN